MPNTKITAMPSLAGNQVPTDLVTAVDLSAAPVNQNVKSTLNDLFATITKNITDRAIRFQAPGSAPAVAAASQGALYHDGSAFLASSNGGAFEPLYTLSAQSAALVFAGPTSGPAATPTFRALALTDLPTLATASLLGRSSAGTGTPEQISSTAALLTWLQNPTSANLLSAMGDETGTGLLVFNQSPLLVTPNIATIRASNNQDVLNLIGQAGAGGRNFFQMTSGLLPNGPTLEAFNSTQADINLIIRAKGIGNVEITGAAVRAIGPGTNPGIVEARGGNQLGGGGKIYLYERSNNGTNYVGFEAPDSIASDIFWTLPATDGTAGQVLSTNGAGILSWATRGTGTVTSVGLSAPSIFTVANSPVTGSGTLALSLATQSAALIFAGPTSGGAAAPTFRSLALTDLPQIETASLIGRSSAGTGTPEQITTTAAMMTWLTSPISSDNFRSILTNAFTTGIGRVVFENTPGLISPQMSGAFITNISNGVPLTITNTGTGNSFVVEDVVSDTSPFVIANDGRVIVGALTGNLFDSFTIGGTLQSSSNASVANVVRATIPSTSTSAGASFASAISTAAAAFTLATLEHFVAIQGTFAAPSVVTQQFGFSARSSMVGAGQNYGFFSAVPAGATNWSFFSGGGAANSRFAGQVLHESGSAAAPSMTFDGDLNTGLAQIGGADNISITTGGTERLRAKSGGAIRFVPLTAAPGSPEAGDVYYNSTTNKLQVYNGTTWQDCN